NREARAAIEALTATVTTLRARVDRTSTSLSFLREVAVRLEGSDPVAAAEAATILSLWGLSAPDRDGTTAHDREMIASWRATARGPLLSRPGGKPVVRISS